MFWVVILVGACALLLVCGGNLLHSQTDNLPRDFDFDCYKNRELNQRGLFDKTKWQ